MKPLRNDHGQCRKVCEDMGELQVEEIPDGDEDFDPEGLPNKDEYSAGTDPYSADSDEDGWSDKHEIQAGTLPTSSDSKPSSDKR